MIYLIVFTLYRVSGHAQPTQTKTQAKQEAERQPGSSGYARAEINAVEQGQGGKDGSASSNVYVSAHARRTNAARAASKASRAHKASLSLERQCTSVTL